MATQGRNKQVDFICLGPGKSGTTALHLCLWEHPDISLPLAKSTKYFDTRYHRGLDWYHSHFESSRPVWGEVTFSYAYRSEAIERIGKYRKDINLILLVRNPADRAFSQIVWNQRCRPHARDNDIHLVRDHAQSLAEVVDDVSRFVPHGRLFLIPSGFLYRRTLWSVNAILEALGLSLLKRLCPLKELGEKYPAVAFRSNIQQQLQQDYNHCSRETVDTAAIRKSCDGWDRHLSQALDRCRTEVMVLQNHADLWGTNTEHWDDRDTVSRESISDG